VPGIAIVTDSSSDIPHEEAERLRIAVVPLTIRFGDEEFVDRVDLSSEEFWAKCKASATLPETAAPSPGAFKAAFDEAQAAGADGVVCITLSSKLSGTYQSAVTAAQSMAPFPVEVIDSMSVTLPLGLLSMDAAELAARGAGLAEIVASTVATLERLDVLFTLDTLEHLKKGGRIGSAQALLGSMLSIKPILNLKDGVVHEAGRQRTRAKSLDYLVKAAAEAAPFERLAIVHGEAPELAVLAERLGALESDSPLIMGDVGPVVGTHAGPGVVGVCWIRRA
jgi:DegV family protein with EDD domain